MVAGQRGGVQREGDELDAGPGACLVGLHDARCAGGPLHRLPGPWPPMRRCLRPAPPPCRAARPARTLKHALAVMEHLAGLAVHHLPRVRHGAAVHLKHALQACGSGGWGGVGLARAQQRGRQADSGGQRLARVLAPSPPPCPVGSHQPRAAPNTTRAPAQCHSCKGDGPVAPAPRRCGAHQGTPPGSEPCPQTCGWRRTRCPRRGVRPGRGSQRCTAG